MHLHECERCGVTFDCTGDVDLNQDDVLVCQDDHELCRDCLQELDEAPRRPLTRYERHQGLADMGHDTWEEVRGER